jgi:hypothetical protein
MIPCIHFKSLWQPSNCPRSKANLGSSLTNRSRWRSRLLVSAVLAALACVVVRAQEEVNWNRARQIAAKVRAGQQLSDEEQKYLQHARQVVRVVSLPAGGDIDWSLVDGLNRKSQLGGSLTPEERSYLGRAEAQKPVWGIADERLAAGVSPAQVQVVFIKQALIQQGQ